MEGFRFVHTADLHLDSPFSGIEDAPDDLQDRLAQAGFDALRNIVDLCIAQKADFLVIAGDVYDTADSGLLAQVRFRDQLRRLSDAGIQAFIAHGNHDHTGGERADLDWPEGVFFFPPGEVASYAFRRNGRDLARIYGISYPTAAVRENYARLIRHQSPTFGIGVLHANVGDDPNHGNYAPCHVKDLIETGCQYLALGHVHTRRELISGGPWAIYPGVSQGRTPREMGAHGCYVVDVDESHHVTPKFVPIDVARWRMLEVPIDAVLDLQSLIDLIDGRLAELAEEEDGRTVVVRATLTGRGPLHKRLRRENAIGDLLEAVRELQGPVVGPSKCWLESIRNRTRPDLVLERLRERDDFTGDFLRLIEAARERIDGRGGDESPEVPDAIDESIAPLYDHPRVRRYLPHPDRETLRQLIDEAQQLGLDLLVDEGGD